MIGGVCLNTGTIPSKTLREAILYLTGLDQREMYGQCVPGQGRDHHRRPGRPHHPRGRPRDGRGAQPAVPQPGHGPDRDRQIRRPAHDRGRRRRRPQPPGQRGQDRDRHRHPARPARQRGVRRAHRDRFRHDRPPGEGAALDGRGGRRGDRHRVRVHVRGPGHQGHRGRAARADAGVLRRRGGRGAQVPPARPGRHVPVRRDRGLGRGPARGRHRHPGERQEDPRRHRHVLGRPPGPDRRPQRSRTPA